MTVTELIKILTRKPNNAKVYVSCENCGHTPEIKVRHFETGVISQTKARMTKLSQKAQTSKRRGIKQLGRGSNTVKHPAALKPRILPRSCTLSVVANVVDTSPG